MTRICVHRTTKHNKSLKFSARQGFVVSELLSFSLLLVVDVSSEQHRAAEKRVYTLHLLSAEV